MDTALNARIDAMLRRDIIVGVTFAALMWLSILFTLVSAANVVDDLAVTAVVAVACGLLGVFNTLALLSMIRRYRVERDHVYGEDIHHLDAARRSRKAGAEVGTA